MCFARWLVTHLTVFRCVVVVFVVVIRRGKRERLLVRSFVRSFLPSCACDVVTERFSSFCVAACRETSSSNSTWQQMSVRRVREDETNAKDTKKK